VDQSATRPPGLYVVGIGAMLFGLLGMCTQGFTIVSTTQQQEQIHFAEMQGDEAFAGLVELQEQAFVPNIVSASFGVIVALALLVFGALTVARIGIALYTPAILIGAAAVELMQLALSLYFQMKMVDMMDRFASGFDPAPSGGGFGGPESFVSAAMGIGLCVMGGWALLKCGFFGAGAAYLRKPEIRQLFESPPPLGPRGD
jgi:hypothetical protein